MFCRSLFVLLSFFFWPVCCLFFCDIRNLSTPLVSSNSSYKNWLVFLHSWFNTGCLTRVARRVMLVEQELHIWSDYMSYHSVYCGVGACQSFLCSVLLLDVCSSGHCIILSALRFMASGYSFGVFNLFLQHLLCYTWNTSNTNNMSSNYWLKNQKLKTFAIGLS